MEVIMSTCMGYCSGVSRAIGVAKKAIQEGNRLGLPTYSYGDLINNAQVCASLAEMGLQSIRSHEGLEPGIIVFRAHGVPDAVRKTFEEKGFRIFDATCPVVRRNLSKVAEYAGRYEVVIVGYEDHAETVALQNVAFGDSVCPTKLVGSVKEVEALPHGPRYAVFVQTTFERILWIDIRHRFSSRLADGEDIVFVNDICPSSVNRRDAVVDLCAKCDAVVVVGGRNSANTKALVAIVRQWGKPVWHIETDAEVDGRMRAFQRIGLTAGASTPQSSIDAVKRKLLED